MRGPRFARLSYALLFVAAAVFLPPLMHIAIADAQDDEIQKEKDERRKRKERYANWMRDFSKDTTIRVKMAGENEEQTAQLMATPIIRYSTLTIADDATVWAWTQAGRPVAVHKVEVNNYGGGRQWTICFASLSEGLVTARWPVGRQYAAKQPGLKYRPIPGAEAPGNSAKARTAQMKALKARFTGRVAPGNVDNKEATEMKTATTPLYQYVDEESKLPLGAIYSMIDEKGDLNPGILLLLEVRPDEEGKLRWEYAGARLGMGQMLLRLDDAEIWRSDAVTNVRDQVHDNWTFYFTPRDFE